MSLWALLLVSLIPTAGEYKQPQIASGRGIVVLTFGRGESVWFAASQDGGRTFSPPRQVAEAPGLNLGMHRGPRIAVTPGAIVISAINGRTDGNLLSWRSRDGGRTWAGPVVVNDAPKSAAEGLHAMAAGPSGRLYAAWLDHRTDQRGQQLYGAYSDDGGETWSRNVAIYRPPSGTICECCHPSLAWDSRGKLHVMFRNLMDGNRDLYTVTSTDGGRTFGPAVKQGAGSWKLKACPMDGGGLAVDAEGRMVTVWRREGEVFVVRDGGLETRIAAGRNPAVAVNRTGMYAIWTDAEGVKARLPGQEAPAVLDALGAFPQLAVLENGEVLAAWERKGAIEVRRLH